MRPVVSRRAKGEDRRRQTHLPMYTYRCGMRFAVAVVGGVSTSVGRRAPTRRGGEDGPTEAGQRDTVKKIYSSSADDAHWQSSNERTRRSSSTLVERAPLVRRPSSCLLNCCRPHCSPTRALGTPCGGRRREAQARGERQRQVVCSKTFLANREHARCGGARRICV